MTHSSTRPRVAQSSGLHRCQACLNCGASRTSSAGCQVMVGPADARAAPAGIARPTPSFGRGRANAVDEFLIAQTLAPPSASAEVAEKGVPTALPSVRLAMARHCAARFPHPERARGYAGLRKGTATRHLHRESRCARSPTARIRPHRRRRRKCPLPSTGSGFRRYSAADDPTSLAPRRSPRSGGTSRRTARIVRGLGTR